MRGLKPDPIMTVSEWANAYRRLTGAESSKPGQFDINYTPFLKEIADKLSVTDVARTIILMKSSQIGATELGNNWLGYNIHLIGGTFMYVQPTAEMIKKTSKSRIQVMIDNTPELKSKIKPSAKRESGNTILEKYFDGGAVVMVGANSPNGVSSTPVRFAYADEIDRYPRNVDGEGNVLSLIEARQKTFGTSKKTLITSTPTIKGQSAIEEEFALTGQRYYHVPCPECNTMQTLEFENVVFFNEASNDWQPIKGNAELVTRKNKQDIRYKCTACNVAIPERQKKWMTHPSRAKFIAKFPELEDGLTYGYHVCALYSLSYTWADLLLDYLKTINNEPRKIAFINTSLGLSYEPDKGDVPNWQALMDRAYDTRHTYEANKPFASVVFITAGVDVQADRIELSVYGWMKGRISQLLDYRVITGRTDQPDVWAELKKVVSETWVRDDDYELPLRLMAVDTGYNTAQVYEFVKQFNSTQVISVKGSHTVQAVFSAPKQVEVTKAGKKVGTNKIYGVGVNYLKSELYGHLKIKIDETTGEIPEWYCYHLPLGESFFRGLTAESFVQKKNKKGYLEYQWHKDYDRNEPLDTANYARAAAAVIGMDRWNEARWDRELLESGTPIAHKVQEAQLKAAKANVVKKSAFWDR